MDRLGSPHGEFLNILGGTYDQRGHLPDETAERFHKYEFMGLMPEGWEVEIGDNAPMFGRSGGAYYVVVLSANGQKRNMQELLDVGVLRENNS